MSVPAITIVPYDPAWPAMFAAEADRLRQALAEQALRIEHVGSTAVPGVAAKPVIDIQISVASLESLDVFAVPLAALGYGHVPLGDVDRVYPFFGKPAAWPNTHHVHICVLGSEDERRHIAFRDHLRCDSETAARYVELKRSLAELHNAATLESRERYSLAKTTFVASVLALARMRRVESAALTLEPQSMAHADEMFAVLNDPAIYEFENAPPASAAWLRQRYARLESRCSADGREQWLNWVIRLPDSRLAGYVQATVYEDGRAAIAYELASAYWGRGLARRAVELMIAELVAHNGVRTLSATLKRANFRSLRLLERMAFTLASPAMHAQCEASSDECVMVRDVDIAPVSRRTS